MKISGEEKKGPVEYIKLLKEKWRTLLILICTAVILFSLFNIFHQFRDYNRSELIYSDIKKIYYNNSGLDFSDGDKSISSDGDEASFSDGDSKNSTVNSTEWDSYDSSAAPSIPPTGSEPVTSPTPEDAGIVYKDPRIERQTFDKLYKINKDIAGWIKIPGTNIDYPVLKGKDND